MKAFRHLLALLVFAAITATVSEILHLDMTQTLLMTGSTVIASNLADWIAGK